MYIFSCKSNYFFNANIHFCTSIIILTRCTKIRTHTLNHSVSTTYPFNNSVFTTYPYIKSVATTLPFSAFR